MVANILHHLFISYLIGFFWTFGSLTVLFANYKHRWHGVEAHFWYLFFCCLLNFPILPLLLLWYSFLEYHSILQFSSRVYSQNAMIFQFQRFFRSGSLFASFEADNINGLRIQLSIYDKSIFQALATAEATSPLGNSSHKAACVSQQQQSSG